MVERRQLEKRFWTFTASPGLKARVDIVMKAYERTPDCTYLPGELRRADILRMLLAKGLFVMEKELGLD